MHQEILKKIHNKFIVFISFSIIVIVSGLISLFFVSDKILCGCISVVGLFFLYVSFSKYGKKSEENTYVITAECTGRSRSGYRKQYLEYLFKTDNNEKTFEIKTVQKEKFKVGLKYMMCFKKNKNNKNEQIISGVDLIYFDLL